MQPQLIGNYALFSFFNHSLLLSIAPQPCRESSVILDYISSTSNTTFLSVRYCVSETYAAVCRDGISDEEADNVCKDQGYLGKSSYYYNNYCAPMLFSNGL